MFFDKLYTERATDIPTAELLHIYREMLLQEVSEYKDSYQQTIIDEQTLTIELGIDLLFSHSPRVEQTLVYMLKSHNHFVRAYAYAYLIGSGCDAHEFTEKAIIKFSLLPKNKRIIQDVEPKMQIWFERSRN